MWSQRMQANMKDAAERNKRGEFGGGSRWSWGNPQNAIPGVAIAEATGLDKSIKNAAGGLVDAAIGKKVEGPQSFAESPHYNAGAFDASNYGYDANKAMIQEQMAQRAGMADPTFGNAAKIARDDLAWREQQQGLASQFQARAAGTAPSVAEMQQRQGLEDAMRSQLAMAKSSGGNPAAAGRMAAMNIADLQQRGVNAAAQLRAQEQATAEQNYGQFLGATRGQDIGLATAQAQLMQGAKQANLQAALTGQGQRDAMAQFYAQQGIGLDQSAQQAAMAQQQMLAAENAALQTGRMQADTARNQQQQQLVGGLLSTAGMAFMSDERAKEDIDTEAGEQDLDEFLDPLRPAKYRYKDKAHGDGDQWSVMAQQLEMSKVGKKMIRETPSGLKMVDYGAGLPALLASQARLHHRLKKLEAA